MISGVHLEASNSNVNLVAGNQYNTIINPSPSGYTSLQRFNGAPTGLLTTQFTGRRKELDFIREVFSGAPNTVPIRCVVCGMPGVGKTSLVLRYAMESFDQWWYSQVLWSSGTTVDKLNEGMAKILDLVEHPGRHGMDQSAKLTASRRWLEDPQGGINIRWLLIIDNVGRKTLGFLREHLPCTNGQGHILFTTRTVDVADALVDVTGASHRKLEMNVPDIRDTTHLLLSSAGIETDTVTSVGLRKAEKLIKTVGSLPLAIVHTASYMKQTHTSLEEMLELHQGKYRGEILQWENDLTSYEEQSVTATFEALFAELDEDSSRFLKLLSFLDPERIPLNILVEGAKGSSRRDEVPTVTSSRPTYIVPDDPRIHFTDLRNSTSMSPDFCQLLTLILSPIQRKAAVQKLQRLSLVQHLFDLDQPYLRIHDLVHYMIGERAKKEATYREWLCSTVSLVCRAFGTVEEHDLPPSWPECEMFIPHLHSLNEKWSDVHGVNLELAKADVGIAEYLISRGRYGEGEAVCKRSVETYEKECGSDHPDTLDAVHILGRTYRRQGRYADAEAAGERVLAVRKRTLGPDHTDTLDSMNTLALVYQEQGRFGEAEELFKGALAGFVKNLGPDHRYTFTVMDHLAQIYMDQGRFDDGEELRGRTLAGQEKNFGPEDIHTLFTVHNLALAYESQNRYAEAEELYKRALLAKEQLLGSTHPSTLMTISCLAHLYQSQERYNEAEEYFKRAFTGRMQELGATHPHTSGAAEGLAEIYRSQGRDSEADAVLNSLRHGQ